MIIRTVEGKLIIIIRYYFTNELTYYKEIYKLMYPYTQKYSSFVSFPIS
jgi:hypothetical protein